MMEYIKKNKKLVIVIAVVVLFLGGYKTYRHFHPHPVVANTPKTGASKADIAAATQKYSGDPSFVGPRTNIPADAPNEKGLSLFAMPVPGVLSRSEQPTLAQFEWLKKNGWKSVVDLREDGEKNNPQAVDSKIPGFDALGLTFLSLPIKDGSTPTDDQADQFLKFAVNPANQPLNVHCAAGIGRTGIMTALYRYSVQGWPMEKAIAEDTLFKKSGMNKGQDSWLMKWAASHPAGSYGSSK